MNLNLTTADGLALLMVVAVLVDYVRTYRRLTTRGWTASTLLATADALRHRRPSLGVDDYDQPAVDATPTLLSFTTSACLLASVCAPPVVIHLILVNAVNLVVGSALVVVCSARILTYWLRGLYALGYVEAVLANELVVAELSDAVDEATEATAGHLQGVRRCATSGVSFALLSTVSGPLVCLVIDVLLGNFGVLPTVAVTFASIGVYGTASSFTQAVLSDLRVVSQRFPER